MFKNSLLAIPPNKSARSQQWETKNRPSDLNKACLAAKSSLCPDPHSTRAKLVRHESICQDWTKEGQRKGHSDRGRQDAARRLPDPQGEKKIP